MPETTLVIGATGRLATPVARALHDGGYTVRILARDPEGARKRFGEGYEVVQGDVLDVERVGGQGDPSEANELLGAPARTLDDWIAAQQGA